MAHEIWYTQKRKIKISFVSIDASKLRVGIGTNRERYPFEKKASTE